MSYSSELSVILKLLLSFLGSHVSPSPSDSHGESYFSSCRRSALLYTYAWMCVVCGLRLLSWHRAVYPLLDKADGKENEIDFTQERIEKSGIFCQNVLL